MQNDPVIRVDTLTTPQVFDLLAAVAARLDQMEHKERERLTPEQIDLAPLRFFNSLVGEGVLFPSIEAQRMLGVGDREGVKQAVISKSAPLRCVQVGGFSRYFTKGWVDERLRKRRKRRQAAPDEG